jgi:hypothetical protein
MNHPSTTSPNNAGFYPLKAHPRATASSTKPLSRHLAVNDPGAPQTIDITDATKTSEQQPKDTVQLKLPTQKEGATTGGNSPTVIVLQIPAATVAPAVATPVVHSENSPSNHKQHKAHPPEVWPSPFWPETHGGFEWFGNFIPGFVLGSFLAFGFNLIDQHNKATGNKTFGALGELAALAETTINVPNTFFNWAVGGVKRLLPTEAKNKRINVRGKQYIADFANGHRPSGFVFEEVTVDGQAKTQKVAQIFPRDGLGLRLLRDQTTHYNMQLFDPNTGAKAHFIAVNPTKNRMMVGYPHLGEKDKNYYIIYTSLPNDPTKYRPDRVVTRGAWQVALGSNDDCIGGKEVLKFNYNNANGNQFSGPHTGQLALEINDINSVIRKVLDHATISHDVRGPIPLRSIEEIVRGLAGFVPHDLIDSAGIRQAAQQAAKIPNFFDKYINWPVLLFAGLMGGITTTVLAWWESGHKHIGINTHGSGLYQVHTGNAEAHHQG